MHPAATISARSWAVPPHSERASRAPELLLLLLALALQLYSWSLCHGYQLADSIEYMELAQALVRGEEVLDSRTIRSCGFQGLLAPIFWVADRVGVADYEWVVSLVRWLQMLMGLALVASVIRLGQVLGGRATGLAAGLLVALNPIYLRYSVDPVSGIAAALTVARALVAFHDGGTRARSLRGGLWLGLALLMAYQSIIIVAPLFLSETLRNGWRGRRESARILAGIVAALCVQVVFDRFVYGSYGATLVSYFLENFSSTAAKWLNRIGLRELALRVYKAGQDSLAVDEIDPSKMRSLTPPTWYLTHVQEMLVWPVLACFAAGVLAALRHRKRLALEWLAVFLLNLFLMSQKGSKDFRLWLPLLPFLAPLGGLGAVWLAGTRDARAACLRRLALLGLLVWAGHLGVEQLGGRNTRKFSGYWKAVEYVGQAERASPAPAKKPRLASAYHWAVFARGSEVVDLVKLPHQLDAWSSYAEEARSEDKRALLEVDWFIVHLPVLNNHPDLMRIVNNQFEVAALFWDHRDYEDIGPIFVLHKNREERSRRFFRQYEGRDPEQYARENGLGEPVRFVRRLVLPDPAGGTREVVERLSLLGYDYELLPGDGHGWITYHWACESPIVADYVVVDRLTAPDESNAWQNNHAPAYGVHPTCSELPGGWQPGWILRESWPVVAAAEPYKWEERIRPMGGEWRRGDLLPVSLWIDLATYAEDPAGGALPIVTGRMEPACPGSDEPLRARPELAAALGRIFSRDGLVRVGRFFLPLHPLFRVPDNGRPIPP